MSYKGFNSVQLRRPERSTFDLSHEKRVSTRIGKLTPILCQETMPNDTFFGSAEVLVKLAPMIAPIFQRMTMYVHYFFVPNRLLWDEWEDFITGGREGLAVTNPPVPPYALIDEIQAEGGSWLAKGKVHDYLGLPPIADADLNWDDVRLDLMPSAAWWKVWYDYYRDRNFTADNEGLLPLPSGQNPTASLSSVMFNAQYRAWPKDIFTSSLPWTQRGAEVLMPLEGVATEVRSLGGGMPPNAYFLATSDGAGITAGKLTTADSLNPTVDMSQAEIVFENSEITLNDFRRANALQMWLERNALSGSRYNESILAHFGRRTSDGRLQRAEYLGGGKAIVKVDELLTTAYSQDAADETVPPANPMGSGGAYGNTNRFSYNCEEHGFLIGILSVIPTTGYDQGWPRMFFQRRSFLDYPWPAFAHLGEQPIYKAEVNAIPVTTVGNQATAELWPLHGYQSRYAEWKSAYSTAAGDFRTGQSLEFWHLVRKFSGETTLGAAFTTYDDANQDRIFNVTGVDTLWLYIYHDLKVKRSLPYFGTPRL